MQKRNLILLAGLLILTGFFSIIKAQCYELVWADEFNYEGSPDSTKWGFEVGGDGGGNQELQYYTNRLENARVEEGSLIIEARKENYGGRNYTSARITTYDNNHLFQYGKMEASIKLPYGKGIWPAFWMLGENIFEGVSWPACGEIDIMEMVGGGDGYDNVTHSTLHWQGADGNHAEYGLPKELAEGNYADTFHVFTTVWDAKKVISYVDGEQFFVMNLTNASLSEFHQKFFILLNLAVGGLWPGNPDGTTVFPQKMEVDWVRVYQQIDDMSLSGAEEVVKSDSALIYSAPFSSNFTYNWSFPDGVEVLTEETDTNQVEVNWGCSNGEILCEITTDCETKLLNLSVVANDPVIAGDIFFSTNKNLEYSTSLLSGVSYNWTVPSGAEITSGQGTNQIKVSWGDQNGDVQVSIKSPCGDYALSKTVRKYGQFAYPNPDEPHTLPGKIKAYHYDYGGEGVAYHDMESQNLGPGPRQDEGVDTEYQISDPNIGWVTSGEWLEYTVKVEKAGSYYLSLPVASEVGGTKGPIKVLLNDYEAAVIAEIPVTGSWSSFQTVFAPIFISSTDTLLRLELGVGGFNFGTLTIAQTTPIDQAEIENVSIYPNPATDYIAVTGIENYQHLYLMGISGEKLLSLPLEGADEIEISISQFETGIYFIMLESNYLEGVSKKILIQ